MSADQPSTGVELRAWLDPCHPSRVPDGIRESLARYVDHGTPLGGFLQAVIANDLVGAASRADRANAGALAAIATVVNSALPITCWGSRRVYNAWINFHLAHRSGNAERLAAAQEALWAAQHDAWSRR